jgi:hypothetical protein
MLGECQWARAAGARAAVLMVEGHAGGNSKRRTSADVTKENGKFYLQRTIEKFCGCGLACRA